MLILIVGCSKDKIYANDLTCDGYSGCIDKRGECLVCNDSLFFGEIRLTPCQNCLLYCPEYGQGEYIERMIKVCK